MKLLAIGVDGLSWRVISPWMEAGHLPHLKRLALRGGRGVLKSTMPPITPPAWYASLTGVNPGRQNIFGFFRAPRDSYAKVPISASDLRAPAIWDYLGREGKKSIILYLPLSYPPRAINGLMVSGFMTPEGAADYACPPEAAARIERAVPGFRLNLDHRAIRLGDLETFHREALEVLGNQVRAAVSLMETEPWDFFFVHLHDIDSITHQFWKHQDPRHPGWREGNPHRTKLLDYYRAVDEEVGWLVEAAGGEATSVILYSDHGFMPAYRFFSVNRWLAAEGYLRLKGRGLLGAKSLLSRAGLGKERLSAWAGRLGLSSLARRLPRALKGAVPQTRFSFNTLAPHIDWERSRAYFLSASEGALYANIRGREPAGSLAEGEAEKLLEKIREGLLAQKDPATGSPVLAGAWLRREIYHGPYAGASPDMILLPADGWYFSENAMGPMTGDQGMEDHQISATHHPDGVIVTAGGAFARGGGELAGAVWDVAPTILRAMGLPVPAGLDGRAMEEALDPRFREANPPRSSEPLGGPGEGEALPPEEIRKIIGNLEGLGYY